MFQLRLLRCCKAHIHFDSYEGFVVCEYIKRKRNKPPGVLQRWYFNQWDMLMQGWLFRQRLLQRYFIIRLRAVSLFSVVRWAKRKTRKWPLAWLMARDGSCCPRFARLAASPLARACTPLTKSEEKERLRAVYFIMYLCYVHTTPRNSYAWTKTILARASFHK